MVQTVAQGLEAYLIDDLAHKGTHEELAGFGMADAALLHVEEGILVELTYGGSVATLHIVGIDLELRLGVHTGLTGETEVAVGLLGVGVLSAFAHEHLAGKGTGGLIVEHILV